MSRRLAAAVLLMACAGLSPVTSGARAEEESEAERIEREEKELEKARAAAAGPAPTLADVAAALADLRPRLRSLGQWCTANEQRLERARIAEVLLAFDPADATAREWLGHKRQKNGRWSPGPWRNLTNAPDPAKKLDAQRAPVAAEVRARLEPFLARCSGWELAGLRATIVRALVNLHPDDAALRAMNGEVEVKGAWVLAESAATAAGRERVTEAVRAAKQRAGEIRPEVIIGAARGEWAVTLRSPPFEILSSVSQEDTVAVAHGILACRDLLAAVAGGPATIRKNLRLYLLRDKASSARFLVQCDEFDAAQKERYARLGSFWLNKDECVIAREGQAERLDSAVRQTLDDIKGPFVTLNAAPPWLSEGLGSYLTFRLLGTRKTVFIDTGDYSDETVSRDVAAVDSDWVLVARKMVEKGYALDLPMLTSLPLNSLSKDDGLLAYALTAYFVEGRPDDLRALLARLKGAKAGEFHRALAESCGVDAAELQVRFTRWLRELPAK